MNALRKKDNYFFELYEYAYDKDGNEYRWDEIILCPLEGEQVNYRISQEKEEELRENYAGMAMQAMVSDHQTIQKIVNLLKEKGNEEIDGLEKVVASQSLSFANALIEELKKKD